MTDFAARLFLGAAGIYGVIGVALGALGAHALAGVWPPERLASFETAVRYQLLHAVFLVAISLAGRAGAGEGLTLPGILTVAGTFLFSGSIYLLCLRESLPLPTRWLGPVTPIGGILLMAAWGTLIVAAIRATAETSG